jgi:Acyl-CoA carboxylase epsilon subunit
VSSDRQDTGESVLRVVRGRPSAEELAALTALVAASETADATAPADPPLRGRWNDPARALQRPLHPGPGAWRAAAWPG